MRAARWPIPVWLCLVVEAAVLVGCTSQATDVELITEPVTRGSVVKTVNLTGTLNPVALVNVGASVSGALVRVAVDFNDTVRAGQLLAQIDPLPYQAQVDQSEAVLRSAKAVLASVEATYRRNENLFERGFVSAATLDTSRYDLESAKAKVHEAEAALRRDRANLAYTTIRAPVSGVVLARLVSVGQTVASTFQTPVLFTLAEDLRRMQIEVSVPEADIGQIHGGEKAEFSVDAYPNRLYRGEVKQVRNNFTTVQNVVTYTVLVDAPNDEGLLRPGMTANVRIAVVERNAVLRVPASALRYEATQSDSKAPGLAKGQRRVYRLVEGKAVPTVVNVGINDGKVIEVEAGLVEGDRVVVAERRARP